jgi:hypothetical protein
MNLTLPKLNNTEAALVTKILQKKGEFTRLVYERPLKFRAAFKESDGVKHTEITVRVGINYDAMKSVQEKRESGELPIENAGLSGVSWVVPNLLLKNAQNELLLRVYLHPNCYKKSTYYLNGIQTDKEDLREMCLASEFTESNKDCFNVKLVKIISLS